MPASAPPLPPAAQGDGPQTEPPGRDPVEPAPARPASLLESLGLFGLSTIEPIVLAALATDAPILLIGPHGTAKSLLLERIAECLGLEWRHYNASQVNYDDLVGYPLPDEHGGLRFVQTPASIWGAQAVFIDEISRCRPDMQNRLFPLIHERRVQGIALEDLRYRWAAMNPPPRDDREEDEEEDRGENYLGASPLDPALADRFNFVVELPRWEQLTEREQLAIVRRRAAGITPETAEHFRSAIGQTRARSETVEALYGAAFAEYIVRMAPHCASLRLSLSGRRANMLYANLIAVHAARLALSAHESVNEVTAESSAWHALQHALPHRAEGLTVDLGRLLVAHRNIWKSLETPEGDPRRLIHRERDPIRRAIRAAQLHGHLDGLELSSYVADGLAAGDIGSRHALAAHLAMSPATGKLTVDVAEQLARLYQRVGMAQSVHQMISQGNSQSDAWDTIVSLLAEQPPKDVWTKHLSNLLCGLFASRDITTPDLATRIYESWMKVRGHVLGMSKLPSEVPESIRPQRNNGAA